VLAGICAGALVYIHPIAPLYAPFALACGFAVPRRPLPTLLPSLRAALVAAGIVAAPYLWALAVLSRRYDVGTGGSLRATGERPVPIESLLGMMPGGWPTAVVAAGLACLGVLHLRTAQPRVAVLLGLWVLVPIAFFTVIPAETRFFVRYLLAALPPLLLLVATGALAGGRRFGSRSLVGAAVVAILVGLGARDGLDRAREVRAIGMERLLRAADVPDALLFSSTGKPISDRPAEQLDTYVALRRAGIEQMEELPAIDVRFDPTVEARGEAALASYLRTGSARRGIWIFRGPASRVTLAERRLEPAPGVETLRVSDSVLVVRTLSLLPPRRLVEHAVRVREAWSIGSPSDRWPEALIGIDRAVLDQHG
jgi:hypothetical protein